MKQIPGYDWAGLLPTDLYNSIMDGYWQGTNWIKETYNEAAPTQNHSFNLAGGTEQSKFSIGISLTRLRKVFWETGSISV